MQERPIYIWNTDLLKNMMLYKTWIDNKIEISKLGLVA